MWGGAFPTTSQADANPPTRADVLDQLGPWWTGGLGLDRLGTGRQGGQWWWGRRGPVQWDQGAGTAGQGTGSPITGTTPLHTYTTPPGNRFYTHHYHLPHPTPTLPPPRLGGIPGTLPTFLPPAPRTSPTHVPTHHLYTPPTHCTPGTTPSSHTLPSRFLLGVLIPWVGDGPHLQEVPFPHLPLPTPPRLVMGLTACRFHHTCHTSLHVPTTAHTT